MNIEKINGFWVPGNDIHAEQWRHGQAFTQNKCLKEFLNWCQGHNQKFNTFPLSTERIDLMIDSQYLLIIRNRHI